MACAGLVALTLTVSGLAAEEDSGSQRVPQLDSAMEDRAGAMSLSPPVKDESASEWVFLPVPKASPAIGGGLQLIGARFFQTDPKSQPSVLGAGAGY